MVARYGPAMDLYRPLVEKFVFPVCEAARGRPTVPLLQFLRGSEHWSLDALRDLQAGLLRRLLRHAQARTAHYRERLAERGAAPEDIATVADLRHLPLLDRETARATLEARTASGPRWIEESSGGTAAPLRGNAESRHWREATRLRGYGWAGYRVGMRAFHYEAQPRTPDRWLHRGTQALARALGRDLRIDSVVRGELALGRAVRALRDFRPEVVIADTAGAAALARFVNQHGLRSWPEVPVIVGGARLWPHDRNQIHHGERDRRARRP